MRLMLRVMLNKLFRATASGNFENKLFGNSTVLQIKPCPS